MGRWDTSGVPASGVYTGTVSGTKVEVTANTKSTVFSVHISNTTAATAYLQIFDLATASVTVGTTTPTYVIGVQASGSVNLTFGVPIEHTTGFIIASTTTRTGATGAAQEVTIIYTSKA
jgi:hypothetical protein